VTDQYLHGLPVYTAPEQTPSRSWPAIARRRAALAAIVFAAAFVAAVAAALLWPATYRSSAVILIEQQEIPQEIVRSTVTAFADERLQIITQRIMTTPTLLDLMKQFDLYALERQREPQEKLLERIRDDIGLSVISADVNDPRSGRPVQATIAFELSFRYHSAQVAHRVANELVTLYQQENRRVRTESVDSTARFLAEEAEKLRLRIEALEGRLADFKTRHVTDLPELFSVNVELLHRTEREMADLRRQLRAVEDRRALINASLAQMVDAEQVGDASSRLEALRGQLMAAQAVYGDNHPDVLRLQRQVQAMSDTLRNDVDDPGTELARLRLERIELRSRYSDRHPDVLRVAEQIAELEQQQGEAPASPSTAYASPDAALLAAARAQAPQSPAMGTLVAQLEAAKAEEAGLRAQYAELQDRVEGYQARLEQSPLVESEYRALTRDYDNELFKYREIKNKLLEAQLAQSLETNQQAERFTVLEYPAPPESPESPNRGALLFVGLVLALGAGVAAAAVSEGMDKSVRGPAEMADALGMAPLVLLPVIHTPSEVTARRRLGLIAVAGAGVSLLIAALLIHALVLPLDTALLLLSRRFGL
jgi:succinoglycan biosynthesis transport protein ExoP